MDVRLTRNGTEYHARRKSGGEITLIGSDGATQDLKVRRVPGGFMVETPDGWCPADAVRDGDRIWVRLDGRTYRFELVRGRRRKHGGGGGDLSSPMPGLVQKVLVKEGDTVSAHQALIVVEAMKMQLEIKAPQDGRVQRILAKEGDQVEAGVALAELETAS